MSSLTKFYVFVKIYVCEKKILRGGGGPIGILRGGGGGPILWLRTSRYSTTIGSLGPETTRG